MQDSKSGDVDSSCYFSDADVVRATRQILVSTESFSVAITLGVVEGSHFGVELDVAASRSV